MHRVAIQNTKEEYTCSSEDNLLKGMEQLNRKGIPVGCRGGGCGVCRVRIESGEYRTLKMSLQHVTAEEQAQGVVLACRCFPLTDLELSAIGKMEKCIAKHFAKQPMHT
jgi:ferredoxin